MKTIIKEKYLYDSNKMLAGQPASQPASRPASQPASINLNKKYGIKRPRMKQTCFIRGRFMFLYLVFTNHKLAKSD